MYIHLLESLIPRLEEMLASRLQRLDSQVAVHESLHGKANRAPRAAKCRAGSQRSASSPTVVLLGRRLSADQEYCRSLIHRTAAILGAYLQ